VHEHVHVHEYEYEYEYEYVDVDVDVDVYEDVDVARAPGALPFGWPLQIPVLDALSDGLATLPVSAARRRREAVRRA
jgi:hypothetical protein